MKESLGFYATPQDLDFAYEIPGFAAVYRGQHNGQTALDRARLISASPELLAALETTAGNLRSLIASCNCNTYDVWLNEVDSAIAKAKGA